MIGFALASERVSWIGGDGVAASRRSRAGHVGCGTQGDVEPTLTVDPLVLALFIDVVERSQHLYRANMRSGIIDDSLRTVLDQEFEQRQCLRVSDLSANEMPDPAHRRRVMHVRAPLTL